jgi:hypothetical protein
MSIQIIDQPGSLGTQLGAGFGKGLAESLPKGIEQGRLSAALKNLEGENLSPLQQISSLIGAGGASPEMAAQLLPYIQQAQARQQFLGGEPAGGQPGTQGTTPGTPAGTQQFTSPESLARKLWSQNPTMFTSIQQATDFATGKMDRAVKEYDRIKENFLQKSGNEAYKDIVGELDEEFRNKLKNSIDLRGNEAEQANKLGNQMLDFAKVRGDLRTNLDKNYLTLPHEKMMNALNKLRTDYENVGQAHNFANDLIGGGMSGNFARSFAQPLEKDQNLSKYLTRIPTAGIFKNIKKTFTPGKQKENEDAIFKGVLDRINPRVSLSSIGIELMSKGYDPENFLKYAAQNDQNLSEHQREELRKTDSWNPNLDDIFILQGKKGVPAWWKRFSTFMNRGKK